MSGRTWGARPGTGLGPGVVRLNDANLVMFRHVLGVVDAKAAEDLMAATRALHRPPWPAASAPLRRLAR